MEIQELLARLDSHSGSFPDDLVTEAIARREEVTPHFLGILEDIDKDPEPWLADDETMLHIWAMYLLALFRETRAYPILVRIFSRPGEFPFDLAGDVPAQDLGRILASVSGGDTAGMIELIENEHANEYVRSVAMDAMVSLVRMGQRTRDEAMSYFLQLFHKLERTPGVQWDGLANACADIWPKEAIEELRRAYEDGLIDPGYIDWEEIERALSRGPQVALERSQYCEPVITDLSRDMGWMERFYDSQKESEQRWIEDLLAPWPDENVTAPIVRSEPKIGRNEPCPCGSGKKFKKCCGA